MEITMNLYYSGVGGMARMFVEEMESSGVADAIRNEDGNLRYEYFLSLDDPETVLLIDSWRDQDRPTIENTHISGSRPHF